MDGEETNILESNSEDCSSTEIPDDAEKKVGDKACKDVGNKCEGSPDPVKNIQSENVNPIYSESSKDEDVTFKPETITNATTPLSSISESTASENILTAIKAQNIDSDKQQESKPDQGEDFTKETPQAFKKIEPKSKVISADDDDSLVIDEAGDDEIKSESDRAGESEEWKDKVNDCKEEMVEISNQNIPPVSDDEENDQDEEDLEEDEDDLEEADDERDNSVLNEMGVRQGSQMLRLDGQQTEASSPPPAKKGRSELARFYEAAVKGRTLRSTAPGQLGPDDGDEDSDDGGGGGGGEDSDDGRDYSWKKTIMIGPSYQASVPGGLSAYGDTLPYENEDKLLWNPYSLSEQDSQEYLAKSQENLQGGNGVSSLPLGAHIRDDEQALFLLLQCGYNCEEGLRRRRMNSVPPADTMSLWSEEECRAFELGLRLYGKDFHMIQQQKVRTRSVGELVQFYYLWKKTERHDVFANATRLEKKKYTLHPGVSIISGPNMKPNMHESTISNGTATNSEDGNCAVNTSASILEGGISSSNNTHYGSTGSSLNSSLGVSSGTNTSQTPNLPVVSHSTIHTLAGNTSQTIDIARLPGLPQETAEGNDVDMNQAS